MQQAKPPVVTIMGHVDHGKTTLLDKIRQSNLTAKESGGITQHIGAYQVEFSPQKGKKNKITFIDTPGHAAFAQMRARGVKATDIAVLVVAADEGVAEQTKESLAHIKQAKIPYLIAISKIDLDGADPEKAKEQLMELGIELEELGGKVPVVLVSGQTGEGVKDLLKSLVAMGKKQKLKADVDAQFKGVVIESSLDSRRGVLNTIIIKNGTLKVKDEILFDGQLVRIKAMFGDRGQVVNQVLPADPVVVLGLPKSLEAGSLVGNQIETAKKEKKASLETDKKQVCLFAPEEKKLPLIIKADTQGTLEAILENLPKEVQLVHAGVGEVADSDIFLAEASGAEIIAFRVKIGSSETKLAQDDKVIIKEFAVIYELLDEVERAVLRMLSPDIEKETLGQAEIIAEFKINKKRVVGAKVTQGEINRQLPVTLKRKEEILGEAKIVSMRHLKEDIQLAKKGQEFGATFSPSLDFKIGDVIISYKP